MDPKNKTNKRKLIEKEIRSVVTKGGWRGNWRKVVQKCKLPVMRHMSMRDVKYNE